MRPKEVGVTALLFCWGAVTTYMIDHSRASLGRAFAHLAVKQLIPVNGKARRWSARQWKRRYLEAVKVINADPEMAADMMPLRDQVKGERILRRDTPQMERDARKKARKLLKRAGINSGTPGIKEYARSLGRDMDENWERYLKASGVMIDA